MRTPYVGGVGGSLAPASHVETQRRKTQSGHILNPSQRSQTAIVLAKEVSRKLRVNTDHISILRFLLAAQCPQINPQLFGFLIQVAAFQAKRFRRFADVMLTALQFRQNHLTLE